jgi:cytochrome b involved in lipid metabolism
MMTRAARRLIMPTAMQPPPMLRRLYHHARWVPISTAYSQLVRGWSWRLAAAAAGAGVGAAVAALPRAAADSDASSSLEEEEEAAVALLAEVCRRKEGLPEYSRAEVAEHTQDDGRGVWVIYGEGVFDITEFVRMHPGGAKRIMLAAGKSVEPFWNVYQQHLAPGAAQAVSEHLRRMRVGNLASGELVRAGRAASPIRFSRVNFWLRCADVTHVPAAQIRTQKRPR